jgi:gluconate kinase
VTRIAITGPAGSGKTTLAAELAQTLGLRHVEIDALHHGPNWESCGPDVLRERVTAATEGDDWVTDWNGNVEPGWRESLGYLIWPALKTAFRNRREFPSRFADVHMQRLRSDRDVRAFVQSIQATASTSGSSSVSARQNTPPLTET